MHFVLSFLLPVLFAEASRTVTVSVNQDVKLTANLSVSGPANFSWTNPQNVTISQGLTVPTLTISQASQADAGEYTCVADFKPVLNLTAVWSTTTVFTLGKLLKHYLKCEGQSKGNGDGGL